MDSLETKPLILKRSNDRDWNELQKTLIKTQNKSGQDPLNSQFRLNNKLGSFEQCGLEKMEIRPTEISL